MLSQTRRRNTIQKTENRGLGLAHIQSKINANLLCRFLQSATNIKYESSQYHKALYDYYILNTGVKAPTPPPYFSTEFFNEIMEVLMKI